jgi:signal transduction histidine kinase
MRKGLTRRTIGASAVLALLIAGAFAVLLRAIEVQRDAAQRSSRSEQVQATANQLERLVLELEKDARGYLVSGQPRFLGPWRAARDALPAAGAQLVRQAAGDPAQERRARAIASGVDVYVRTYAAPLVAKRSRGALAAGEQQLDLLRERFDRFTAAESGLLAAQQAGSDADRRRAIVLATAGLAGSILLIAAFAAYMTRAVALPVRRAAAMAERVAGGDLSVRMPETGVGEVGTLERSFNSMAGSLGESRDELRLLAEEQAALRRVATLVARAVPPADLFEAVAIEVRQLLGADSTRLLRNEPDRTTVALVGGGEAAAVEVGAPIVVEGRAWGVMVAGFARDHVPAANAEARMEQFTELVATAIANANSRFELAASRARVVTTADETRRRIERDLHDGAQQSLTHTVVSLKLARRSLGDADGTVGEMLGDALGHAERATDELRDLAHGILPAALTRGGLRAAVSTLVSRMRLPVAVDVTPERFSPALEATAYFIVAEALTNVVKHAGASRAAVRAFVGEGALHVEVRDDGAGGARTAGHSGLMGLHDRAAALDGSLRIRSRRGAGTVVSAVLPLGE